MTTPNTYHWNFGEVTILGSNSKVTTIVTIPTGHVLAIPAIGTLFDY